MYEFNNRSSNKNRSKAVISKLVVISNLVDK